MMPCNMVAFTSSMTRPLLRCTEISLRLTSRIAQSDCSFGWIASRRCLRGLMRFYSEPLRLPSPPLRLLLRWLSRSRPCCDLPAARLLPLIAGWQDRLANEHSYPSLLHLALFLSTFCLHISTTVLAARSPPVRLSGLCVRNFGN